MNIYIAAPLHDKHDQERNSALARSLRVQGHRVYLPQEHGVWEDTMREFGNDEERCRRHFYEQDLLALSTCDVCIAYQERTKGPSEGMMWEMGWAVGANKRVMLLNTTDWKYNLMPEFGSTCFTSLEELIAFLGKEDYL